MIDLSYYECLPDFMPQHEVEKKLKGLLEKYKLEADRYLLDSIYELSSHQVNNYALVANELRLSISEVIISSWDMDCIDNTETCIAIITNLGLQVAYEFMKEEASNVTNSDVKHELDEAFIELGESVEDVGDIS